MLRVAAPCSARRPSCPRQAASVGVVRVLRGTACARTCGPPWTKAAQERGQQRVERPDIHGTTVRQPRGTVAMLVSMCERENRLADAVRAFEASVRCGLLPDAALRAKVADAYERLGRREAALEVLSGKAAPPPTSLPWMARPVGVGFAEKKQALRAAGR
ncbi:unnamed protein product [Prorocentrum cordatum]|uniref:Uncharacterized protein n=1 Tax=Prorocentrum cordatum TaxID=2364126 RepID=A0ABN9UG69_9DINO|nr:unnamed protein product [Polarella glacialis]